MRKKTVRSILYIGEIIFCFLGIFDFKQYGGTIGDAIMHQQFSEHYSLVDEVQISFGADPPFETFLEIFIWLFFVSLAVNVLLSVFGLIKPKRIIPHGVEIALNVLSLLFFIIVAIIAKIPHTKYETELGIYFDYIYEFNVLFIIFSLIILANFALLFISFPESTQKKPQCSLNAEDVSISLKQYKDLLDNGIITQEEFDKKKKQLLQ